MKAIKKVEVTPIDYNIGKIIDSAATTDDKTKNTYSMRVIDNELDTKINASNIVKVTKTVTIQESTLEPFDLTADDTIDYPEGFNRNNSYVVSARVIPPYGDYAAIPMTYYDNDRKITGIMNYSYYGIDKILVFYDGNAFDIDDELTFELILMKID